MKRILNKQTPEFNGKKVKVSGWADSIRLHGKLVFIDLRDKSGILQTVITPKQESAYEIAKKIRSY